MGATTLLAAGRRGLSIRRKVLAAFLVLSAITALVGAVAIASLNQSGRLVAETYDRPLMAISFARQTLADFLKLEAAFARRLSAKNSADTKALDISRKEGAAELESDLDVVAKRATSERARKAVERVRDAVTSWMREGDQVLARTGKSSWADLDRTSAVVYEQIDLLVNYAAGDGFKARQEALATIETNRQVQLGGTIAALVLSMIVVVLLVRRIVGPVAAASRAAKRIAEGELDVDIPVTGRDELASLLDAMSVMRDNIRAMMNKEIALRRSAQVRMIDAIESASEGVIVVDADGRIVVANTEVQRRFGDMAQRGYSFYAMIANAVSMNVFAARTQDEREALLQRLGADDSDLRLEEKFADGRWVRIGRNRTAEGGFVAIFSDITLQKEREALLRESAERSEAANRMKSEFLSTMSHELRTPLNAVIGFAEVVESETFGPLGDSKYKEFAGDILSGARRLLNIINDILEWTKLDAGHLALDIEAVDLAEVFEDCKRARAEQFERAGVTLRVQVAPRGVTVQADRAKLRLILNNLLSNAAKFTPHGGSATLSAAPAGDRQFSITVADTGIGMRPEDLPIALSPFGQIDSTLSRKFEGTGLGLALVNAFVERHGGILSIETAPGRGTSVTVTLDTVARPIVSTAAA